MNSCIYNCSSTFFPFHLIDCSIKHTSSSSFFFLIRCPTLGCIPNKVILDQRTSGLNHYLEGCAHLTPSVGEKSISQNYRLYYWHSKIFCHLISEKKLLLFVFIYSPHEHQYLLRCLLACSIFTLCVICAFIPTPGRNRNLLKNWGKALILK